MSGDAVERLRRLCGTARDGALLRFALGNALVADGSPAEAIGEFRRATEFDPNYSAAWKLLGRTLAESGDSGEARRAWSDGIAAAERAGDVQAQKEMQVFLKRLDKADGDP